MFQRIPAFSWLAALGLVVVVACSESPTTPTPDPPTPPACTYTLSTLAFAAPVGGGPTTVNVTTGASCAWTAQTTAPWLSVTSGATGTGPGVVTISAEANATTSLRTGTVTIGGITFTVQQDGLGTCSFTIAPTGAAYTNAGGSGNLTVTTASHCTWQTTSTASWITIVSGGSGTGPGTVEYTVAPRIEPGPRSGTLNIANRTFTVEQSGDVSGCTYSIAPVQFEFCMAWPGDRIAEVTTQAGCPWTATSTASWITVAGGATGTGSGNIVLRGQDNWTPRRVGTVEVRWPTTPNGQNVVVDQGGCQYGVSRATIPVAAAGGTEQFNVLQQAEPFTCGGVLQDTCEWTAIANVPWITITTTMPQVGDGALQFTVAANPGAARTGTITVRDKIVTVNQGGQ
jgi:hypothetical protein